MGNYFKNKLFYFIVSIAFVFFGCGEDGKVLEEIENTAIDLSILRFDNEFASAKPNDIPKLRQAYPYLFPAPDSVWVAKLEDSLQQELREEVKSEFSDFSSEANDIEQLFKHLKYYFPNFKTPKVITVTNDVDYNNRIILADSLLLVGLDNYLGTGHKYYTGLQAYVAEGMNREYIVSDIASAYANRIVPIPENRTFLARIVYYGKMLFIKDKLMPFQTDAQKINYSEDDYAWAEANEEPMWRHFIERELLYSTNLNLNNRFIDPAPFSKFGLELDNESPGRLGRFIGWQIVRAFMEKNEIGLQQMLQLPAEEIFKKSNYKPTK